MSGLISAAAKRLRDALALVTGAGLVGYSNAQAYTAGTLGAGLKAEEVARDAAVTAVANDVATLTASVGALSDEVDANATAASAANAATQAGVDALTLQLAALITPGFSVEFSGPLAADPPGWFIEDGRALNVADEPGLFAAIGYTWGGAGPVFNLPDTRDDFTRGAGPGRPVGTREQDAFQGHEHATRQGPSEGDSAGFNFTNGAGTSGDVVTFDIREKAGGFGAPRVANETRPRNVAKFKLIKR